MVVKKRHKIDRDFTLKQRIIEIWKVFYLYFVAENAKKLSFFLINHIPSLVVFIVFVSIYFSSGADITYFKEPEFVKLMFFSGTILSCVLSIIYPSLFHAHVDKARILNLQFRHSSLAFGRIIFDTFFFLISQLIYLLMFLGVAIGVDINFKNEMIVQLFLILISFTFLYTNVLVIFRWIRTKHSIFRTVGLSILLVIFISLVITFYVGGFLIDDLIKSKNGSFTAAEKLAEKETLGGAVAYHNFHEFVKTSPIGVALLPGTNWFTPIGFFFGMDWIAILFYIPKVIIQSYIIIKIYSGNVIISESI